MVDNNLSSQPLNLGGAQGGSPSDVYLFFYLRLCDRFFDNIDPKNRNLLDARIAALIAFLPDKSAREEIWAEYSNTTAKDPDNTLTASIHAVGNCIEYFSSVMDLTKVSWAGFA
jgi:hypothetical protein